MVRSHTELKVYQKAFDAAMKIFQVSKKFPKEETYSLTDQVRRSSRSVCANLAEAWRKRRYEAAFVSKLSDSESEAAETQVWLQFAVKCEYVDRDVAAELYHTYDEVLGMLVEMINHPEPWLLRRSGKHESTKAPHTNRTDSSPAPPLPRSSARKGRQ
jgi:four helix bundle protein